MSNNIHPVNEALRIAQTLFQSALEKTKDHGKGNTTSVITKAFGNVERCVRGYSKCEGFSGVLYRIWNAIKAIFGQSDWQIARRSLKDLLVALPQNTGGKILIFKLLGVEMEDLKKTTKAVSEKGAHIDNKELNKILESFVNVDGNKEIQEIYENPIVQRFTGDKELAFYTLTALYSQLTKFQDNDDPSPIDFVNMLWDLKDLPELAYLKGQIEELYNFMSGLQKEDDEDIAQKLLDYIDAIPEIQEFASLLQIDPYKLIEPFEPMISLLQIQETVQP